MFNRVRTKEVFGYDIDLTTSRKSKEEQELAPSTKRNDMRVVDNCPSCGKERIVNVKQSKKNKPCSKCFHAQDYVKLAKQNKKPSVSEETKAKMRANHWSKKGMDSPFKGAKHTPEAKAKLSEATRTYYKEEGRKVTVNRYIKGSCTQRGIPVEDFNGFSAPEGARIRQSAEGKAWTLDVLSKANFTCVKCNCRGGSLHAHHKNAFSSFPEQRFDVENGACLCDVCHDEFHKIYGKGDNTKQQFEEWIGV